MPFITSGQIESKVNIYYNDLGKGKNIVFIHGWPLNSEMWEYQVEDLYKNYRCITYDRRGFGKSDWPGEGYDYNTLASDLKSVMDALDLQDVTLVGFSMGGGEVAKYFSLYNGARVSKVVLLASVLPFMLQTGSNPIGAPREMFEGISNNIKTDRPGFFQNFGKIFYGADTHPDVSEAFLQNNLTRVMNSSPIATLQCAESFAFTDFRDDMPKINVPTLIIHGDADQIVPIKSSGEVAARMITGAEYKIYTGAPHGLWFTDKDKQTTIFLLLFLSGKIRNRIICSSAEFQSNQIL